MVVGAVKYIQDYAKEGCVIKLLMGFGSVASLPYRAIFYTAFLENCC